MNTHHDVKLQNSDCPCGCVKKDKSIVVGKDLLHGQPGEFKVVKCLTCGLMRTDPRPTQDTIGVYYPSDYAPYLGTCVREDTGSWISKIKQYIKPMIQRLFQFNTQLLPKADSGSLLEVGCASGAFLHKMANQDWRVEGIEFSEQAASAASQLGYKVFNGPLEKASLSPEQFDLIVGWMVLEHLHDPIAGLKKLHECAKPGAWLVISVPNAASFEFRFFKEKWFALQLPTHLYHYTPETLCNVLRATGWSLCQIHHQRVLSNLISSCGYVLYDKGYRGIGEKLINFPDRYCYMNYIFYPLAWLLSLFGQTGRMTVWARKM